jgi:transposase-like protein
MSRPLPHPHPEPRQVAAATRGQIIQRVLVDGLTPAEAAALFGVGERQVMRWVAAYRRRGMASLRDDLASEPPLLRWFFRLRSALGRLVAALSGPRSAQPARCIVLRRGNAAPARTRAGARSGTETPTAP